ncbi:MAG: peptide ABC transporter substrate-binding protein, partial [Chlamydiia bacterium]|nr:peptide ABC transporter substrate-binding protein [Chlamydiia bacterium]
MIQKLLLAALAATLFTSCASQDSQPSDKKELKLNFFAEPPSLDPRTGTYSIYSNILPMLFDGLMRFDQSGALVPSVAKEVSLSADGKTYTFRLKKTFWSNGDPVTAHDFEFAWKWILDPDNPAPMASHLYCIRGAKAANEGTAPLDAVGVFAKDSMTLVVELEHPLPFFPEMTAIYNFFPFNARTAESEEFIGNGPFKLEKWKPHQEITLVKNRGYWDAKSVKLDRIHISFVQDMNTELELFERGELDWAGAPTALGLAPNAFPKLRAEEKLHCEKFLCTYFYTFNTERRPFRSPKVRHALSKAIPRQDICDHITQGSEEPAYGFVPPSISYVHTKQEKLTDEQLVALYQEGLAEQGLTPDTVSPIYITYNTSDTHHAIAQTIQHCWKELFGLDVRLRSHDWKAHLSEISAGNFDVARLTWKGMTSDPYHFLEIFEDPKHPMQRTSWRSNQFLAEMDQA